MDKIDPRLRNDGNETTFVINGPPSSSVEEFEQQQLFLIDHDMIIVEAQRGCDVDGFGNLFVVRGSLKHIVTIAEQSFVWCIRPLNAR